MTRAHRLSFLKVLAAMAWADGQVEEEERNRIKVLFNRFDLEPGDRKEVDALLDRPVTFERALEITKEFAGGVALPGARKELIEELEAMAGAESDRSPAETELLEHVRAILASHTVVDGLVEKLRGLFSRTLFAGRSGASPRRLREYPRNGALRRLGELLRERGEPLDESLPDWNRITLLGGLLARVAHLGGGFLDAERRVVEEALTRRRAMTDAQRDLLLRVVAEESEHTGDLQQICAEYCRVSTMDDRLAALDDLFAVACADGGVGKDEVEQIRRIADFLWISNPEYLSVRDRYRDRIRA
jgi:uncharacterized tellurite resistance protein B-like protein